MIEQKLERLAAAGFQIVPVGEMSRHIVFERNGFVSLVERTDDGFGRIGAGGMATEQGFAVLSWRGEQGFWVARGFEQPATAQEVNDLRAFERDLHAALSEK